MLWGFFAGGGKQKTVLLLRVARHARLFQSQKRGVYNDSIARGASAQSGVRSTDVDVWARTLSRFECTTAEYKSSSRKNLSCSNATLELWKVFLLFSTHLSRLLLLPCLQPSGALKVCTSTPKLPGLPTEWQQTISANITTTLWHLWRINLHSTDQNKPS